ncbi:MAG: riboflavin biosynthesis protein RibF [Elusimicrobia bacterium]|nr:riboflavin biosynthesis protein RibF [Elusimicrobiota bacterium]
MRPRRISGQGAVVTIGTFDGVHRGHQAILNKTVEMARRLKINSQAVTFARPPRLYFFPQNGPNLITVLPEKVELLESRGIDRVEVLSFNKAFSGLSADRFFEEYLVKKYRTRAIVVGYNFGFGRSRQGDTRFLEDKGRAHGIPVHVAPPVCLKGVPISSGLIRQHLKLGELDHANRKLGYSYFLSGKVVRGQGRGRTLGFPTANLKVPEEKLIPPGVFAVNTALPDGRHFRGMCNVGFRPTMSLANPSLSIEVHLFGFHGDLVGESLRVEFARRIRSEKKFASWRELARQLAQDELAAKRFLTY